MTTINEAFINALLADAAYVNVTPSSNLETVLANRMTPELAKYIADNFTVASAINSGDELANGSGFDGVIWRGRADTPFDGKMFVSMRGTEGVADFVTDANLALFGDAAQQTADMVNWWLRETTPVGQTTAQIAWRLIPGTFVATGRAGGTGRITDADRAAGVYVNGHSLGGYLAAAFTRLLGTHANVLQTTTFNSAGFAAGSDGVFAALQTLIGPELGRSAFAGPRDSSQLNYFAQHGLNLTTNTWWFEQTGQRIELFNEESATQIPNHFMYKLTDALALAVALQKLDPSLTLARANALFEAGSTEKFAELERTLDGVIRVLNGSNLGWTPTGDVSASAGSRLVFHRRLEELSTSEAFRALEGRLRIDPSNGGIGAKARSDFSAMASLLGLSPVVLTGTNAENAGLLQSTLQSVWGPEFALWQADRNLTPAQHSAGQQNYTDQWIADRARLLNALALQNQRNSDTGVALDISVPTNRNFEFEFYNSTPQSDITSLQNLIATSRPGSTPPAQQITFGDHNANQITGTTNQLGDHLYGGAGADTVRGLGGNDHLEGNAGADSLEGGAGNDTLLGGAGDDSYRFEGAFGSDIIIDATTGDTLTAVGLGAINTANVVRTGEHTWRNADSTVFFSRAAIGPNRTDLVIDVAGTGTQARGTITVQHWQEGQLGLSLGGSVQQSGVHTLSGGNDFTDRGGSHGVPLTATVVRGQGGHDVVRAGLVDTSTTALQRYGDEGNDIVFGNAGNDVIAANEFNWRIAA